jgi:hypothetical protein
VTKRRNLSRAELLPVLVRKTVEIPVPGSEDGCVTLRELNGIEKDHYEAGIFKTNGAGREVDIILLRSKLIARCLVDDDGKRLYRDDEIGQLAEDFPASFLEVLWSAARELNGMAEDSVAVEKKSSSVTPSAASTSVSH